MTQSAATTITIRSAHYAYFRLNIIKPDGFSVRIASLRSGGYINAVAKRNEYPVTDTDSSQSGSGSTKLLDLACQVCFISHEPSSDSVGTWYIAVSTNVYDQAVEVTYQEYSRGHFESLTS